MVAGLLVAAITAGCTSPELATGQRPPAVDLAPPGDRPLSMDDVRASITELERRPNVRFEYFQQVVREGEVSAGSLVVPLVRGELADGVERLTAEMGVTLDFGDDDETRMNLIADADSICVNVPFFERVLGDSSAPADFAWMIPLIDGWGCIDLRQAGESPDVLSIFGADSTAGFLGVASILGQGELLATDPAEHRGRAVQRVTVQVPPSVIAERLAPVADASSAGPVEAHVLLDVADRIVSASYAVDMGGGVVVHERLEVFDHGLVDPIELPADAIDVTEPVLELLAQPD